MNTPRFPGYKDYKERIAKIRRDKYIKCIKKLFNKGNSIESIIKELGYKNNSSVRELKEES